MRTLEILRVVLVSAAVAMSVACAEPEPAPAQADVSQAASDQYVSIFDGQTLAQWRGDSKYWSVEDGAITGRSTQEVAVNTFLIHEGTFGNFELRFKYRFPVAGNSGMQVRSRMHPLHEFAVAGYQANVVTVPPSTNERFAMWYEERDRGMVLAESGERTVVTRTAGEVSRKVVGAVNTRESVLAAEKPYPEWNEQVVVAYDNRLVNWLNGVMTADMTDNDEEGRALDGFIALQMHSGPPMAVQFKDLEVRRLTSSPDMAGW